MILLTLLFSPFERLQNLMETNLDTYDNWNFILVILEIQGQYLKLVSVIGFNFHLNQTKK